MAENGWQPEHVRIKELKIQKLIEKEPLGLSAFEERELDEYRAKQRKKEQSF